MNRRTKIVATLGPATKSEKQLEKLIKAGVNVVRFNFSHGTADDHRKYAKLVRHIAQKLKKSIAILGDLQGPKIRIGAFSRGSIILKVNDTFILDANFSLTKGDIHCVGLAYRGLPNDCRKGNILLLDDGRLSIKVISVIGSRIETKVLTGGKLSDHKGINLQGGGLSAQALTDKDKVDIQLAAEIEVDYLAVSFVRKVADIVAARSLLQAAGGCADILAKIERSEVVENKQLLENIIKISDAVMVARGDLGVEIGDAELVGVQKHIISEARRLNRPVITATQMMESMIYNTQPTRAEVFDVANAVLDGTDAVMLSAETAIGKRPSEVVIAMARICLGAEKQSITQVSSHRINYRFSKIDETIAMSAMYAANHLNGVKAIICLTKTGSTPLWMSRINTGLPIYALTRYATTARRVALYRGVEAIKFDSGDIYDTSINQLIIEQLKKQYMLVVGDRVILTKGKHEKCEGGTNTLQVLTVT